MINVLYYHALLERSLGVRPYEWIQRLIQVKDNQGLVDGPAISDKFGRVLNSRTMDQGMHDILELYATNKEFIPSTIKMKEDIVSSCHASRSFRWSSSTRALNKGLCQDDIDLVNHWHQVEKQMGVDRHLICVIITHNKTCSLTHSIDIHPLCEVV
jgi:hypothetical protein